MECRKHLGKEEILKAEGKKRGKMGMQWTRWTERQREKDPGNGEKKRLKPESEEFGDFEKTGCGLEESAATFSIYPDSKE